MRISQPVALIAAMVAFPMTSFGLPVEDKAASLESTSLDTESHIAPGTDWEANKTVREVVNDAINMGVRAPAALNEFDREVIGACMVDRPIQPAQFEFCRVGLDIEQRKGKPFMSKRVESALKRLQKSKNLYDDKVFSEAWARANRHTDFPPPHPQDYIYPGATAEEHLERYEGLLIHRPLPPA